MTVDALEKPVTQAIATDVEPDVQPEGQDVVPENTSAPEDDSDLLAALKELDPDIEGSTDSQTPKQDKEQPLSPEVQAQVKAEVARRTAEQTKAVQSEQRQRYVEGIRQKQATRKSEIDQYLSQFNLDAAARKLVTDHIDQQNGELNVLREHDLASLQTYLVQAFRDTFVKAVGNELPDAASKEITELVAQDKGTTDIVKAVVKAARKDYLTPSEAKKQADARVVKLIKEGVEKKGWIVPGYKIPNTPSNVAGGGGLTDEAIAAKMLDPTTPVIELKRLREIQKSRRGY